MTSAWVLFFFIANAAGEPRLRNPQIPPVYMTEAQCRAALELFDNRVENGEAAFCIGPNGEVIP